MTDLIKGRIKFQPKPHQAAVLNDKTRHRGVVMHRRAGKTVMAIFAGLEAQLSCPLPSPRVGYIAPYLKQAKKLAWDYLESVTRGGGKHFEINRGDLFTRFVHNDGKFMLLGADNLEAIRGMYFDLIVVDELADCDPRLWNAVIRPALADRKGRALLMGTPKGRMNMLYDLSLKTDDPSWSFHKYDVTQTDMLDAEEIEAARRDMPDALFQQEFMCSFNAALVGAVYGREMNDLQASGRFLRIPYDPAYPVVTAWDLGYADATAIWYLQLIGSEIRAIEYEEHTLKSLVEIGNHVRRKPYTFDRHYGPHDLHQHELGSGNSRADILSRLGIEFEPPVNWPLEDGIEATRALIPHLAIDTEYARMGLECLINYEYVFDESARSFKTQPRHNWASHGADAMRMLAVALDKRLHGQPVSKRIGRRGERQLVFDIRA